MKKIALIILLAATCAAQAQVKLPALFSDNMVLQQNTKAAIWGWAKPGETIVITGSWGKTASAITGADGKWQTTIKTIAAGGPYTLTVAGSNSIQVNNILLGEVWLASGQSNMEFFVGKMNNPSYTGVIDYQKEIAAADFPNIRLIDVPNKIATEPTDRFESVWKVCSPKTVDSFSAVAYYFARKVQAQTGYPIGIINSTWGGTPAESWTSKAVLEADPDYKPIFERFQKMVDDYPAAQEKFKTDMAAWKADTTNKKPAAVINPYNYNKAPFVLYNGMIAPVKPFTVKGFIWYQGESNADRAYQYRKLFPAMIANWRADWNDSKLPFYFVQISPHRSQNAEIREAQLMTMQQVKHTGMAVTIDNGDSLDIHPRNKKLVGERLALWPLHDVYKKDLIFSGPVYRSMKVKGSTIELRFNYSGDGLKSSDGGELREFTIAGADQQFYPAKAVISGNRIIVSSDAVAAPVAVRFAWRNLPKPNLYNNSGLPATPFRTDSWKGATEGKN